VLLGELAREGQTLRVAVGGRGGRGNAMSPSKPYGPASRARTDGQPGQEVRTRFVFSAAFYAIAWYCCSSADCA
jgi:GTPase involved in cell partitioning and DNA repair